MLSTKRYECFDICLSWQQHIQESRKHYNQLEEARKLQHARKLKLEAQEVALGERDRVTANLGESLFMGAIFHEPWLVSCCVRVLTLTYYY